MNWLGNLRNWFIRLSNDFHLRNRIQTRNLEIERSEKGTFIRPLFQQSSSSPVMQPFTGDLSREITTPDADRYSFSHLPPDESVRHQHLATIMKEHSLLLWTLDFKNPSFPTADEARCPETGQREYSWAKDHLVPGWELLQRWLLHPVSPDDEFEADTASHRAPLSLPMWYIHPAGQLMLDESMTAANCPIQGHRLVILLSRSPDQAFVEKIGRHLSGTNLQPVLLAGPAILRQIPSHGNYFLPRCTEITFLLDQADYSVTNHTILNAMRHQMCMALSIPTTLEFTQPVNSPVSVVTPIVETDRSRRMANPWFPSKDEPGNMSRQGRGQGGDVRVFPPPGNNPDRPRGPRPDMGFDR